MTDTRKQRSFPFKCKMQPQHKCWLKMVMHCNKWYIRIRMTNTYTLIICTVKSTNVVLCKCTYPNEFWLFAKEGKMHIKWISIQHPLERWSCGFDLYAPTREQCAQNGIHEIETFIQWWKRSCDALQWTQIGWFRSLELKQWLPIWVLRWLLHDLIVTVCAPICCHLILPCKTMQSNWMNFCLNVCRHRTSLFV